MYNPPATRVMPVDKTVSPPLSRVLSGFGPNAAGNAQNPRKAKQTPIPISQVPVFVAMPNSFPDRLESAFRGPTLERIFSLDLLPGKLQMTKVFCPKGNLWPVPLCPRMLSSWICVFS